MSRSIGFLNAEGRKVSAEGRRVFPKRIGFFGSRCISNDKLISKRPGRSEARVRKHRPKAYPLLRQQMAIAY
ncbi:MAG: hypothetical protein C4323_08250 [Mastigocladus sp. ERB_26_2]